MVPICQEAEDNLQIILRRYQYNNVGFYNEIKRDFAPELQQNQLTHKTRELNAHFYTSVTSQGTNKACMSNDLLNF